MKILITGVTGLPRQQHRPGSSNPKDTPCAG